MSKSTKSKPRADRADFAYTANLPKQMADCPKCN